jgi:hypothetical protein
MSRRLRTFAISSVVVVGCVALAFGVAGSQEEDRTNLGAFRDVGPPIVTDEGDVLIGVADGPDVVIVRIPEGTGSPERITALTVEGLVDDVELATVPPSSDSGDARTLAVVVSCPTEFIDAGPGFENAKVCGSNSDFVSFELDSRGRRTSEPAPLPDDVEEGRLFATGDGFLWAWSAQDTGVGRATPERANYFDGAWQVLKLEQPSDLNAIDQCTTLTDLWILYGNSGPRSLDGLDNAMPKEDLQYTVFRYELVGESHAEQSWKGVDVPGLELSDFAELACGRNNGYVAFDDTLYALGDEVKRVENDRGSIYSLVDNRGLHPVVFVSERPGEARCALIDPDNELVYASEPAGSADQNRVSVCDGVPWEIGDRYAAVYLDPENGDFSLRSW